MLVTTPADGKAVLVLNIEDEEAIRSLVSDILVEAGYRVIAATSADHALVILGARPDVQVIVTDARMPGDLDGFALARTVAERQPEVRILVTSGALEPGAGELPEKVRFLAKPFTADTLLREVQAVFDGIASRS